MEVINMKILNVSFSTNVMHINYEVELYSVRKNRLSVNETKYEEKAKEISNQVKWIKGFNRFSLSFGEIDWYESCDRYAVPYFTCSENGKRVKKDYIYFNDVPKGWTVNYCLIIETPSSMRGINKFFKVLKLNLNEKQLNKIRKALKEQKYCSIELEED